MNSFILSVVLAGIIISSLVVTFAEEIKSEVLKTLIEITANDVVTPTNPEPPANAPQETTTTHGWVPEGFVGPNGQPKIIGPKGNPPNY